MASLGVGELDEGVFGGDVGWIGCWVWGCGLDRLLSMGMSWMSGGWMDWMSSRMTLRTGSFG